MTILVQNFKLLKSCTKIFANHYQHMCTTCAMMNNGVQEIFSNTLKYSKFLNDEGFPKNIRKEFDFGIRPETRRWFPKHMTKGQFKMQRQVHKVDCVIEIHDARIPYTGRNPMLEYLSGGKPSILLLNKSDLVKKDNKVLAKIREKYSEEGINNVFFTCLKEKSPKTIRSLEKVIPYCIDLIQSTNRFNRGAEPQLNIMVVGIPNVGKSSLIKAARQHYIKKHTGVSTGANPGHTRQVSFKIKVCANPLTFLVDTPGILDAKINDLHTGMKLAICNTIPDSAVLPIQVADYLLFLLNSKQIYSYVEELGLPGPTDSIQELVKLLAYRDQKFYAKRERVEGTMTMVKKPNLEYGASKLVYAFRRGQLGKIMLDDPWTDEITRPFTMR